MKKILVALVVVSSLFATQAQAHGGWGRGFVTGAVIGGAAVYAYSRPHYYYNGYYAPYYAPPPVVYVQPQPVYVQQPYPNMNQETILDQACNCYRTVWVQN